MTDLAHTYFGEDFWTPTLDLVCTEDEFHGEGGFVDNLIEFTFPEDDQVPKFVWEPMLHQIAPDWLWDLWLMMGGRGTGKTDGGAHEFNDHMMGPPCDTRLPGGHKAAIIAPTLGDAYQSCVEGVSGLKVHNPLVTSVTRKGGTYVTFPNQAQAKLFGAYGPKDVDRLRAGGNNCFFWAEELAAWPYLRQVWDQLQFGLRLGKHPRGIATTTPKARKLLKELLQDTTTAITSAKTEDNPYLPEVTRKKLHKKYAGTRLGKQELGGQLLEDVPGAVATVDELADGRIEPVDCPPLTRRIAMVDPSQTNTETSDAAGIAVSGRRGDEVFQLFSLSMKADVRDWVDELVRQAVYWECAEIWYESTGGSDTYKEVIQAGIDRYNEALKAEWLIEFADVPKDERPPIPNVRFRIKPVPAKLSKRDRAVALEMAIQQRRFHLVGEFETLEEQLTTWVPGEGDEDEEDKTTTTKSKMDSPNEMDASVHAYRVLMGIAHGKGRTGAKALQNSTVA